MVVSPTFSETFCGSIAILLTGVGKIVTIQDTDTSGFETEVAVTAVSPTEIPVTMPDSST